jgi:hypothetical protein
VSGFSPTLGIHYDYMHSLAGWVKDLMKNLLGLRRKPKCHAYDIEHNKRHYTTDPNGVQTAVYPWELTPADKARLMTALKRVVKSVSFDVLPSRFARIGEPGKASKSHDYKRMASPFGECACYQLTRLAVYVQYVYMLYVCGCMLYGPCLSTKCG